MQNMPLPLNDDETVLWRGHSQKPAYTAKDVVLYIIPGVLLILIAFYVAFEMRCPIEIPAEAMAFLSQPMVLGLLFLFGALLPLAPILWAVVRRHQLYIFTDKRAIIYNTLNKELELEIPARDLPDMKCTEHANGLISLTRLECEEHKDATFFVRNGFEYIPADVLEKYK